MSEIKACFPSRFPNGVILETDFSQLEVVALAAISMDPTLIADLVSGMDMHRVRAAELFDKPQEDVTSTERTITKRLSFQLQYGAGAKSMAKKLRIKKALAKSFVENYYARYPRVKEWQEEVIAAVKESRIPTGNRTKQGAPQGRGEWYSPTGRTYVFFEQDKPEDWQGLDSEPDFNPPTIKNYPIQGFATGDIMAVFRGRVYRKWVVSPLRKECLPINTVHDSIMFDCVSVEAALKMKALLEEVVAELPELLLTMWGIESPVPFAVETKIGPTWATTTKVK